MTFGVPLVMRCPGCRNPLLFETIGSGNTCGGSSWSDGKVVYPMLPDEPLLRLSPPDDVMFWIDECKQIGVFDKGAHPEWKDLEFAVEPSEAHYLKAIQAGMGKMPQQEFYLRQRLWWAGNDRRRHQQNPAELEPVHLENLHVLMKRFGGNTMPDALVFQAEIMRELSLFEAAIELLDEVVADDSIGHVADLIFEQAKRRNPFVFELTAPEEGEQRLSTRRAGRRSPNAVIPRNDPGMGIPRPPLDRMLYYGLPTTVDVARTLAETPGLGDIDRAVIKGVLNPEARVLDAGCGAGRVALGLWEMGYRHIEACDFSPAQVEAAQALLEQRGAKITVTEWDFTTLPVPDGHFDAVICLGTTLGELFSKEERLAVMKEFARVVRLGGHLIFSLRCGIRESELDHILSSPRFVPGAGWNGGAVSRDVCFGQVTLPEIESFGPRCYHIVERIKIGP